MRLLRLTSHYPTIEGRAVVRTPNTDDYTIASRIANDLNGKYDLEQNEDEKAVEVAVIMQAASIAIAGGAGTEGIAVKGQSTVSLDGTGASPVVGDLIKFAAAGANPSVSAYKVVQ